MSLIQMSISAAVMIFMITVIRALAINHLPKKTFIALWGIVLARLLVPFSLHSPFSVYSLLSAAGAGPISAGVTRIPTVLPAVPVDTAMPPSVLAPAAAPGAGSLWLWIWGIGFTFCALYFTLAYIRCLRRFMTSQQVENDFTIHWLAEHSCRRPVTIRQSSDISAPLTYGIARPVILMPSGTDWAGTKELQYVLAHEYVHIRRFDGVTKLLLTAALCIHWFNPLVWVMYILANRDIELSCDEKVVRLFGETIRSAYALALIEMEEKKSGLTPLCSHFSKNAIEERIEAIMKVKKITVFSLAAACAIVVVMGSTFATSAAERVPDHSKDRAAEQTEAVPYGYSFRPDPQIYSRYSDFGITISEDGERLLYNGQRVRLFVDEHADGEAFFFDEAGALDLSVNRDASGNVAGIEGISQRKAQEYRNDFFADDTIPNVEVKETVQETSHDTEKSTEGSNKLEPYSAYGITLSEDGGAMYYSGERVKLLVDELSDGNFLTFWTDEAGTANLSAVRNKAGQITAVERISEEEAQGYLAAANEKEQFEYDEKTLNELEDRITKRINERYSDH